MKITAVTSFKLGALYAAVRQAGITQRKLAELAGINDHSLSAYINLRRQPNEQACIRIQNALAALGVEFDPTSAWPDSFPGLQKTLRVEQTQEIDPEQFLLASGGFTKKLADYNISPEDFELAIEDLSPEYKFILERVMSGSTVSQIAKELDCSISNVNALIVRIGQALNFHFFRPDGPAISDEFRNTVRRIRARSGTPVYGDPVKITSKGHILSRPFKAPRTLRQPTITKEGKILWPRTKWFLP
jgi:transcriptional regulator with XRE-family HTH domain